jgi:hypothetical protein
VSLCSCVFRTTSSVLRIWRRKDGPLIFYPRMQRRQGTAPRGESSRRLLPSFSICLRSCEGKCHCRKERPANCNAGPDRKQRREARGDPPYLVPKRDPFPSNSHTSPSTPYYFAKALHNTIPKSKMGPRPRPQPPSRSAPIYAQELGFPA